MVTIFVFIPIRHVVLNFALGAVVSRIAAMIVLLWRLRANLGILGGFAFVFVSLVYLGEVVIGVNEISGPVALKTENKVVVNLALVIYAIDVLSRTRQ